MANAMLRECQQKSNRSPTYSRIQESGVRSQESGVKLAWCLGFNLDSVPFGWRSRRSLIDLQSAVLSKVTNVEIGS